MSQTIYIDRKYIQLKGERSALAFYTDEGRQNSIPYHLIKRLVITTNCQMDIQLLGRLSEKGITTVILSSRHAKQLAVVNGKQHNDANIRLRQYQFVQSPQLCLWASKQVIQAKLLRQLRILHRLKKQYPRYSYNFSRSIAVIRNLIIEVPQAKDKSVLLGLEGAAARQYFQSFSLGFAKKWQFSKRTRRPPLDPVNAVLSFSYTLLHTRAIQALNAVGLDPMIGFMHETSYGRESLAADIIEPFRISMDAFVFRLFKKEVFTPAHFERINSGGQTACYLNKDGRREFYPRFEAMFKTRQKMLNFVCRKMVNHLKQQEEG